MPNKDLKILNIQGQDYELIPKQATNTEFGGIKAETKTSADNQEVKIDANAGKLYVNADANGAAEAVKQNLQQQIDGITSSSDVHDVVGTKQELNEYNTSELTDRAIIKVLNDDSQGGAITYYRWNKKTSTFDFISATGPYYTKSETETLVNSVDNKLDTHILDKDNPHAVTKAQVGLGNADNTSDLDKPISKATQAALDEKANTKGTYVKVVSGSTLGIVDKLANKPEINTFIEQITANGEAIENDFRAFPVEIGGNTIAFNQLSNPFKQGKFLSRGIDFIYQNDGTIKVNGTNDGTGISALFVSFVTPLTYIANHSYFVQGCPQGGSESSYKLYFSKIGADYGKGIINKVLNNINDVVVTVEVSKNQTVNNLIFRPQLVDLTLCFGAGNEPTDINDPRIANLRHLLSLYPDFNEGTLINAKPEKLDSYNTDNELIDTLNVDYKTSFPNGLNGINDIHDSLLRDTRTNTFKAIKRIGEVDLGALDWSEATYFDTQKAWESGLLENIKKAPGYRLKSNIVCSKYNVETQAEVEKNENNTDDIICIRGAKVALRSKELTSKTPEEVKAALNGVILQYELATLEISTIQVPDDFSYLAYNKGKEIWNSEVPVYTATIYARDLALKVAEDYSKQQLDVKFTEIDNKKANKVGVEPNLIVKEAFALTPKTEPVDSTFISRVTANGMTITNEKAEVQSFGGETLVYNQLVKRGTDGGTDLTIKYKNDSTIILNGTSTIRKDFGINLNNYNIPNGHVILYGPNTPEEFKTKIVLREIFSGSGAREPKIYKIATEKSAFQLQIDAETTLDNLEIKMSIVDLTQIFGITEVVPLADPRIIWLKSYLALHPDFTEGTLINAKPSVLTSYGQNLCNQEFNVSEPNASGFITFETTNFIKVLPNQGLVATCINPNPEVIIEVDEYDINKQYVGGHGDYSYDISFKTSPNTKYVKVKIEDFVGQPALNVYFSNEGIYGDIISDRLIPYRKPSIINIDYQKYFPEGMNGVGNVRDTIEKDKATKRFGEVDLGTLPFFWNGARVISPTKKLDINKNVSYPTIFNGLCANFESVSNLTFDNNKDPNASIIALTNQGEYLAILDKSVNGKTSEEIAVVLSGVILRYELVTPVVTPIDPELDPYFEVENGGMEIFDSEVPTNLVSKYSNDITQKLVDLPTASQITADLNKKQNNLIPGNNIKIDSNNTISTLANITYEEI